MGRIFSVTVVFLVMVVILSCLTGSSVNAQSQVMFAVQVTKTKERLKSGLWFPIFLSLTTNDATDEEFAFSGSTRNIEPTAFQGLGLKVKIGSVGIKNLTNVQLAAIGIDEEGICEQKKTQGNLSMIPEKAWHEMNYIGGVCLGGIKIKTDRMPIGGNVLAIRIKHKDDKDWTYFLVFESGKDVPGELQTGYVLYIQKAPIGYDPMTWSPEEKFYFLKGFTFYRATSSDPEKSKELAYVRLPKFPNPCIVPNGGNYVGSVRVAIGVQVKDALVHVTCDGSEPTIQSPICANDMVLNKSCVIKAKAFKNGYQDSETASAEFVITPSPPPKAEKPTITLSTVDKRGYGQVGVTITSKQGGAIRLTVDGTEPTEASAQYVGQFGMDTNGIVKAKVFADGFSPSDVACAEVTVKEPPKPKKADQPIINASSTTSGGSVCVAMTSITPRAVIRYTTDGNDPNVDSPVYAGAAIIVRKTTTFKVRVYADGYLPSDVETRTYRVETPTVQQPKVPPPKANSSSEPPVRAQPEAEQETGGFDLRLSTESKGIEVFIDDKVVATILGKDLKDTVDFVNRTNVITFDHFTGITLTKVPCGALRIVFLDESESSCWRIRKDKSDPFNIQIVDGKRFVRWNIQPGQRLKIYLERGKCK